MEIKMPYWQKIIMGVERYDISSNISKYLDITYSHVVKILSEFERKGWIKTEKTGRIKLLQLTKEGKKVSDTCKQLRGYLND